MDLIEQMKIFVRVFESGSFTAAAESLNMPKASVSLYIQRLEDHLDTRLFHRTTRKVTITQDGQTFYDRCKDLLADVDETEGMFKNDDLNVSGRIRVDMPLSLARNIVMKKLSSFMEKYPKIEIELGSTDRKVDVIREGFDCVVRVGTLQDSGLIARQVGKYTMANCVSPAYVKKYGMPKKLDDLSKHLLIHYVPVLGSKPDGFEYFDGEKYQSYKMRSLITVNNSDAYQASCLAGMGIIQVPLAGVKDQIKNGSMVEVLSKFRAEPMPVNIIYPHRRNQPRRVRLFMEWLETILKDYVS